MRAGAAPAAGLCLLAWGAASAAARGAESAPIVWRLDQAASVGGHRTQVLGGPRVVESADGSAVTFDGTRDGLIVPANPLAGWGAFTIEALLQPGVGGLPEQRFLHLEDEAGARALLEIRLTHDGHWALDTFLLSGPHRLPLLDLTKLHPAGVWHWVALRYDGQRMTSFVNGRQELEGAVEFSPMKQGRTSLGVRLNQVYWFKGAIREVRFHPSAIAAEDLQKAP